MHGGQAKKIEQMSKQNSRRRYQNGGKAIFKEIMAKRFSELINVLNSGLPKVAMLKK